MWQNSGILAHFCNKLFKTPLGLYGIINIEVFRNYFTMRGISMIQRKRLAAALLSLTMAFAAVYPAVPSFAAAWERNANGSYVAADGSALTGITARGIDVSHWK